MISFSKFSPRNFDWLLFFSCLLLCTLGLAAIYSVELSRGPEANYYRKQLIAIGIGLLVGVCQFDAAEFFPQSS